MNPRCLLLSTNPLKLPNPIYDPYELDPRDPFCDERYGGLDKPDDERYKGKNGPGFRAYQCEVLMKGFKLTPREFVGLDLKVKSMMFELKAHKMPDISTNAGEPKLWPVKHFLLNQQPIFVVLKDKTNGYFALNSIQRSMAYRG